MLKGLAYHWVQKNIIRVTEDEIETIRKGQKKDKILELEIESSQITSAEGPSDPMDLGQPPELSQSIDLGGPTDLSENDSIEDENVPIRIQNCLEKVGIGKDVFFKKMNQINVQRFQVFGLLRRGQGVLKVLK